MAFPTILGVRHSHVGTSATSITVLLPNGSNVSGYLVIICVTKDGAAGETWPSGWTLLDSNGDVAGESRTACRYRILNGTEGFDGVDDSISVSGPFAEEWAASAITISAWHGATAPELAFTTANSGNADPPLLDPAGWGTENTLWIVYTGVDGPNAITGYPTNYTGNQHGDRTSPDAGACGHGFATRNNAVASEDPSTFSHPTDSSRTYTIAVRPSALSTQLLAATLASVLAVTPWLSVFRELAGLLASIPNTIVQRFVTTALAVTSIMIGLIVHVPSKVLTATLASVLAVTSFLSVFRVVAATTPMTILMTNAVSRILAATTTTIGLLTRVPSKLLAATAPTIALMTFALSKVLAATTVTIALMTSGLSKVLAATLTGTGLLHALKRIAQDRQGRWRPRFLIRMDWP